LIAITILRAFCRKNQRKITEISPTLAQIKKCNFGPYIVLSLCYRPQKLNFTLIEDMQIKKNALFYFGLRIILPIQIQLLAIENP
jgi:hypothetical protein